MVLSILFIAVLCYVLCLPDVCALVSIYGFQEDLRQDGASDYTHILNRYGMIGLCYALLVDLIRALIAILVGGFLLKNAGFPDIGRLLVLFFTLFFMLTGQAFPALSEPKPCRSIVFPALLLVFVDWRVFLVCAVVCIAIDILTGLQGLSALLAAVFLPLFSVIFGNWSLFSFLMLLSGLSLASAYLDEIRKAFRLLPRRIAEIPRRLRSLGAGFRARLVETARKLNEEDEDEDDGSED